MACVAAGAADALRDGVEVCGLSLGRPEMAGLACSRSRRSACSSHARPRPRAAPRCGTERVSESDRQFKKKGKGKERDFQIQCFCFNSVVRMHGIVDPSRSGQNNSYMMLQFI